jgi:hypothetical protein
MTVAPLASPLLFVAACHVAQSSTEDNNLDGEPR